MELNLDKYFEKIYKENYCDLCMYIYRMVSDDNLVEDIVQETFYEAYRKRKLLYQHPKPVGWLYITARYKMLKLSKKNKDIIIRNCEIEGQEEDVNFNYIDLEKSLEKYLTEKEITMLKDYIINGYTAKEMSLKLGISEGAVKTRVFRIKEKIKKNIKLDMILFICIIWGIGS